MKYKHIVLGGTFDHLHTGHQSLLATAFSQAERVTIGLVSDEMLRAKKHTDQLQSLTIRRRELSRLLRTKWPRVPYTITPILDIFGPSITDRSMDAIIATEQTLDNVHTINTRRRSSNLHALEIIMAPEITAQDGGVLSSTRIRLGEIDRKGAVYQSFFVRDLYLPENARPTFREPLGDVVAGSERDLTTAAHAVTTAIATSTVPLCISVGDVVTTSMRSVGYTPHISILDYRNRRKSIGTAPRRDVDNEPGTIQKGAVQRIAQVVRRRVKVAQTIVVSGEEDLLVLPSVLLAPLGSVVLYGQADQGVVVVHVTERSKMRVKRLISLLR